MIIYDLFMFVHAYLYVKLHLSDNLFRKMIFEGDTVDWQINYSNPASMSCRLPPVPQISTLWFRIFVPDLRVWFISSIRRSEPNQKNNIVIRGARGYWSTRVWIIRPSTVSMFCNQAPVGFPGPGSTV